MSDEADLLEAVSGYAADHLQDGAYLTAYDGETWNGGFDLPFLRSACHRNDIAWPFDDVAYADTMEAIQRFDTGETGDLVGVYDRLIGAPAATRSTIPLGLSRRGKMRSGCRC